MRSSPHQASEPSRVRRTSQHRIWDPKGDGEGLGAGVRCRRPSRTGCLPVGAVDQGNEGDPAQSICSRAGRGTALWGNKAVTGECSVTAITPISKPMEDNECLASCARGGSYKYGKARNQNQPCGVRWKWIVSMHVHVHTRTATCGNTGVDVYVGDIHVQQAMSSPAMSTDSSTVKSTPGSNFPLKEPGSLKMQLTQDSDRKTGKGPGRP